MSWTTISFDILTDDIRGLEQAIQKFGKVENFEASPAESRSGKHTYLVSDVVWDESDETIAENNLPSEFEIEVEHDDGESTPMIYNYIENAIYDKYDGIVDTFDFEEV